MADHAPHACLPTATPIYMPTLAGLPLPFPWFYLALPSLPAAVCWFCAVGRALPRHAFTLTRSLYLLPVSAAVRTPQRYAAAHPLYLALTHLTFYTRLLPPRLPAHHRRAFTAPAAHATCSYFTCISPSATLGRNIRAGAYFIFLPLHCLPPACRCCRITQHFAALRYLWFLHFFSPQHCTTYLLPCAFLPYQ